MRFRRLACLLALFGLVLAGCGWNPPSAPQSEEDQCAPADRPTQETVKAAVDQLAPPPGDVTWQESARGHAANCRLFWVQLSAGRGTEVPQQVLFFDRNTPLGTATSKPRPYTLVLEAGDNTVTVQYQWRQGNDAPCCPTGIGQVRFKVGDDGKLEALDPIPNQ